MHNLERSSIGVRVDRSAVDPGMRASSFALFPNNSPKLARWISFFHLDDESAGVFARGERRAQISYLRVVTDIRAR